MLFLKLICWYETILHQSCSKYSNNKKECTREPPSRAANTCTCSVSPQFIICIHTILDIYIQYSRYLTYLLQQRRQRVAAWLVYSWYFRINNAPLHSTQTFIRCTAGKCYRFVPCLQTNKWRNAHGCRGQQGISVPHFVHPPMPAGVCLYVCESVASANNATLAKGEETYITVIHESRPWLFPSLAPRGGFIVAHEVHARGMMVACTSPSCGIPASV